MRKGNVAESWHACGLDETLKWRTLAPATQLVQGFAHPQKCPTKPRATACPPAATTQPVKTAHQKGLKCPNGDGARISCIYCRDDKPNGQKEPESRMEKGA